MLWQCLSKIRILLQNLILYKSNESKFLNSKLSISRISRLISNGNFKLFFSDDYTLILKIFECMFGYKLGKKTFSFFCLLNILDGLGQVPPNMDLFDSSSYLASLRLISIRSYCYTFCLLSYLQKKGLWTSFEISRISLRFSDLLDVDRKGCTYGRLYDWRGNGTFF